MRSRVSWIFGWGLTQFTAHWPLQEKKSVYFKMILWVIGLLRMKVKHTKPC